MEKRVLITIVVCVGILLIWMVFFSPKRQQPGGPEGEQPKVAGQGAGAPSTPPPPPGTPGATPTAPAAPRAQGAPRPGTAPPTPGTPTPSTPTAPTDPAAAAPERLPEQVTTRTEPGLYEVSVSSWGARVKSFRLLHPQYTTGGEQISLKERITALWERRKVRDPGPVQPLDVVTISDEVYWPLGLTLGSDSRVKLTGREDYRLVEQAADRLVFRWQDHPVSPTVVVDKEYRFFTGSYPVELTVRVSNMAPEALGLVPTLTTSGAQDPNAASRGFFSGVPNLRRALCQVGDELEDENARDLKPTWEPMMGAVQWAGTDNRYFMQVVVPKDVAKEDAERLSCARRADGDLLTVALSGVPMAVPQGQTAEQTFTLYFGPKEFYRLKALGFGLHRAVDFSWLSIICEPMLWVMRLFHHWTGNWGIAILGLTLLVKLLLLYFTHKSFKSMAEMQKLKPEMDKIREKYGEDKERLNQEMVALYQRHKVNPLGGCLPMVFQMPIYFALYRTIYSSVELYRAEFFLYIRDLSSPDPYFITPLLLGGIMFLQQQFSSATMDSAQARMMKWMMPTLFTALMLFLPSGLVLYILANSTLTIAQQYYIKRQTAGTKKA